MLEKYMYPLMAFAVVSTVLLYEAIYWSLLNVWCWLYGIFY